MPITVEFSDPRFASQPCAIAELDHLAGLATDGSGLLTFDVPVTLDTATITFAALGVSSACRIGHLDPIETLSGVVQRLKALGYIAADLPFDPDDHDVVRGALEELRDADGECGAVPYDEAWLDFSPDFPVSITAFVSPGAVQYPSLPNQAATSAAPASSAALGAVGGDGSADVVVNEDGTIDDASRALLLRAYGC